MHKYTIVPLYLIILYIYIYINKYESIYVYLIIFKSFYILTELGLSQWTRQLAYTS